MNNIRDMWYNIKGPNMCAIKVQEGKRKNGIKKFLPYLAKGINLQILEAQGILGRRNTKKTMPMHIVIDNGQSLTAENQR